MAAPPKRGGEGERGFAEFLSQIDRDIPIALLTFFIKYMVATGSPRWTRCSLRYRILAGHGLRRVCLGNVSVFCRSEEDFLIGCLPGWEEHVGL